MNDIFCPHCNAAIENDGTLTNQLVICPICNRQFQMPAPMANSVYVSPSGGGAMYVAAQKNPGVAIMLALLFGPFGMLYSTISGAAIMFIINIPVLILTFGLGIFITQPICVIWAGVAANSFNQRIQMQSRRGNRRY